MLNVETVLKNLDIVIAKLESEKREWRKRPTITCKEVCQELSIFDWFPSTLSISRLKDMKRFLLEAKKLGFTGYCCFKVGEEGTASGKWAYIEESKDGYSPSGAACLFESFYASENYWQISDGKEWYPDREHFNTITTLKGIEQAWVEFRRK